MATDPMEGMLRGSSLHVLELVLQQALSRNGYGDVEILGRRRGRQKSRFGGFEMRCHLRVGTESGVVLVKVIEKYPIRNRMIHEAAGCVIEHDALFALVISPFERSASKAKKQVVNPKLRVRVIEGPDLATLVNCSGIGRRPNGDVDYAFFGELEARSDQVIEVIRKLKQ